MRNTLIIFIVFFSLVSLNAQQFEEASLYFEDAQGRKDTLTFGMQEEATELLDEELGEVDIQDTPIDSFDVRFFKFFSNNLNDKYNNNNWYCENVGGKGTSVEVSSFREYLYESKEIYFDIDPCVVYHRNFFQERFFIPVESAFPVIISWDNSLFQDICSTGSFMSEIPFLNQDRDFCPDLINHPFISLVDSNSVILEQPSLFTILRADSVLVSTYYINIPNTSTGDIFNSIGRVNLPKFDIQPNPVVDILNIDLEKEFAYTIQNARGQVMQKGRANSQINVVDLPDGIYFIQIQDKDNLYQAQKFVKL